MTELTNFDDKDRTALLLEGKISLDKTHGEGYQGVLRTIPDDNLTGTERLESVITVAGRGICIDSVGYQINRDKIK
jgi:hypothetical protein